MADEINGAAADEWRDTSDHLLKVVAAFQRDQWVATDCHAGVMRANVGTMAGTPLAGLVACASLSACTKRCQLRMREEGFAFEVDTSAAKALLDPEGSLEWPSSHSVPIIVIVDEDVYPTLAEPDQIFGRLQTMAVILFDEYTKAGLQLHLHVGKTAGMVTWIGKGRIAAQQQFEASVAAHGGIPFSSLGRGLLLPVTLVYKH